MLLEFREGNLAPIWVIRSFYGVVGILPKGKA